MIGPIPVHKYTDFARDEKVAVCKECGVASRLPLTLVAIMGMMTPTVRHKLDCPHMRRVTIV